MMPLSSPPTLSSVRNFNYPMSIAPQNSSVSPFEPLISEAASSAHPLPVQPTLPLSKQRPEAFAQQVRGAAHDINNALTIVVGYAQLLESQPDLPPHLLRQAQSLLHEATRAVGQTELLLQLSSWNQEQAAAALHAAPPVASQEISVKTVAMEIGGEAAKNVAGAEILVVDDEEPIITLISEILSADGHRVTPAFNGAEAIAWTQMRDFDLIISDVRMPAVGGPAFFEILQTTRPDLLARVVFVTGDTVSGSTRQFLQSADRPVLAKPFDPERLRSLVGELLTQI